MHHGFVGIPLQKTYSNTIYLLGENTTQFMISIINIQINTLNKSKEKKNT